MSKRCHRGRQDEAI